MSITSIIYLVTMAFGGYLLGRWGHYYLNIWLKNPKWAPHHWIYGLVLIIPGLSFFKYYYLGTLMFSFGAGQFISDLKDFLQLKFIGPDEEGKKIFWGIS